MSFVIIHPNNGFVTGQNDPCYTWNPTEALYFDSFGDASSSSLSEERVMDRELIFKPVIFESTLVLFLYRYAILRQPNELFAVFHSSSGPEIFQHAINPVYYLYISERLFEGNKKECLKEVKRRMKEVSSH